MKKIIICFICIVVLITACDKKNRIKSNDNDLHTSSEIQLHDEFNKMMNDNSAEEFEVVNLQNTNEDTQLFGNPIYKFSSGNYSILDISVDIQSQPNLTSSAMGRLELHSEIEILENTEISQVIEDVTSYWYKIKYNDIVGYIWGGFIAVSTETIVLDDNVKVYLYYRFSGTKKNKTGDGTRGGRIIDFYHYFDSILPNDIFIYINSKRVSTRVFEEAYYSYNFNKVGGIEGVWEACYLRTTDKRNEMEFTILTIGSVHELHFVINIKENGDADVSFSWAAGY